MRFVMTISLFRGFLFWGFLFWGSLFAGMLLPGHDLAARAENIISGDDYRIVDGDTIHLGQNKIRLIGIDAPERHQQCRTAKGKHWPCGRIATDMLTGMVTAASGVTCIIDGRDRYQRMLGTCFAGQDLTGVNLQQALIRAGLAVAEYDHAYRDDEAAARTEGRGIWNGCFTRPKDWRRKKRNCD